MSHKLSLWSAIFININIMFGTGIFINTVTLATLTGFLGFVTYGLVALLIVPLIFSIAALLKRHPSGGFYTYGAKDISPFAGFFSAWAYFVGKLASAALLIHVFSSLLFTIIPSLSSSMNIVVLDMFIIGLFAVLNTLNMKTSSSIIYTFIALKLTPILFAIVSSLYLFNYWSVPSNALLWTGIPLSIPLVLYAFTGFEASCSLSRSIKDAECNAPKAILYSFSFVVVVTILYQLLLFLTLNTTLMQLPSYLHVFPTLLTLLTPSTWLAHHIVNILHIALASSSLGGSYGILFSNHWNLYTLAQHHSLPGTSLLTRFNKHHIPVACVVVEALLCVFYLVYTGFNVPQLQQISVLGCTIAYSISIFGMILAACRGYSIFINKGIVALALGSCGLLLLICVRNFILGGISSLLLFSGLLVLGSLLYILSTKIMQESS